jgi:hypothetical protein
MLGAIAGLLKLAAWLAKFAADRQLISAGEARATAVSVQATLENIDAATKAKNAMATGSDPDWAQRVRDKYDRK